MDRLTDRAAALSRLKADLRSTRHTRLSAPTIISASFVYLEHREGIEPSNTGFAVEKYLAFSVTYRNPCILHGVEKKRWELAQWCENGVVPDA
jgi:hypothetical protein